jgi:hypothetical protein
MACAPPGGINSAIHSNDKCPALLKSFICYYLFFTGQMEYARLIIISSSVGD